jgi:hypothetical protein
VYVSEWSRRHDPRTNGQAEAMPEDEEQKGGKGDNDSMVLSAELFEQANCGGAVCRRTIVSQRLAAAGRIYCDRRQ